jgi:hypothetical protein
MVTAVLQMLNLERFQASSRAVTVTFKFVILIKREGPSCVVTAVSNWLINSQAQFFV